MTTGGYRNKLSLNLQVFMCSLTHKKNKNPMLVLLQITNGDKQQNKNMYLFQ